MLNYNPPPLLCGGHITLSNIDEICPLAIPIQNSIISMHIPSLVKIHWCIFKISVKYWRNLPISNPNPELNNIIHIPSLVTIHWRILKITLSNIDEICPLAIPIQNSIISYTYQVWWKSIDVYSSYHPETKIWVCLGQITWLNLPISNPKPNLHNINAHTKFSENPLMFTQVIIRRWKTDRRTKRRTDRHTDFQHEITIPHHYIVRHYIVAGYNNINKI